jgi:FKBP-type peptidyl-prolyl cis-trans isomerase SlyD
MISDKLAVQDGQVVGMDYTLHVDGEILDSSDGHGPLEFLQGSGNLIPGLESELYGMTIGESKQVVVAPVDGYGEIDANAVVHVPRSQFPANIPMEVGTEIQVNDQQGHEMMARIDLVENDSVRLDFNHPLAGKELKFDVKIVSLRAPTEEELDHGHVHNEDHHE